MTPFNKVDAVANRAKKLKFALIGYNNRQDFSTSHLNTVITTHYNDPPKRIARAAAISIVIICPAG